MKHNLTYNFHNAQGAEDEKMKADILTSEVAKLIVKYPQRIIENLEAEKFSVSDFVKRNPTGRMAQRRLVGLTSNALHESKSFAKRITEDILSGNYSFSHFSQDGDTKPKEKITFKEGLESASNILSAFGNIFGGKQKAKKAEAEAKKAKYDAEKALHEKTTALSKDKDKKQPMGLYIGIGVAVAIGITAIVLIARK